MSEGIPVNPSDLPIDNVTLDDSRPWRGKLDKVTLALKTDTNGHFYVSVRVSIVEDDDYEGLPVGRNYLALPIGVPDSAPKKVKIALQNHNAPFARFARQFGINKPMPVITDIRDSEARQALADYFQQFEGNVGSFTVENREFPEGSGRITTSIRDFVAS